MRNIRILVYLLILITMFVGCESERKQNDVEAENTNIEDANIVDKDTSEPVEESENDWGVTDSIVTINADMNTSEISIELPYLTSITKGYVQVAYQPDNTLIYMGGQDDADIMPEEMSEVLNAFINKPISTLEMYSDLYYGNYNFEITGTELVEINGYDMCRYEGEHTFTYDGEPKSMAFVAYTAHIESNDTYIYWIVIDETEDQSMTETISEHARKMAESVHE